MRVCHNISAVFDDPNLIGTAGLVPVMGLAEEAGLADLVAGHVSVPGSATGRGRSPPSRPGPATPRPRPRRTRRRGPGRARGRRPRRPGHRWARRSRQTRRCSARPSAPRWSGGGPCPRVAAPAPRQCVAPALPGAGPRGRWAGHGLPPPVTERGRLDNEDLHAPKGDQVLDRDQISQVNDPNLKR